MTAGNSQYEQVVSTLSRRKALAAGAGLLTAGGSLVIVGEPSSAAVSIDSFDAANQSWQQETVAPQLDATVAWSYDVGMSTVGSVEIDLAVDGTTVATETLSTDRTTLSNETTLSGSVLDSDAWAATDFEPAVAATVERTVSVTVTFAVLDGSGSVIVSDSASDTATLSVSHPQESTYTASVGGSVTFRTPSQ